MTASIDLQIKYVTNADGTRTLTLPDEVRAAAIAFIREHALEPSAEMEAVVQQGHDELIAALAGVSETQAAFKPAPDEWSILQLMDHVVSTKQLIGALSTGLAAGNPPPGAQFEEPAAQDGVTTARFDTLAAARAAAEAAHQTVLQFIRSVDPQTNTELTFKHFVFGSFHSREWAIFHRIHDNNHTPQIAEIKASPGYPAA